MNDYQPSNTANAQCPSGSDWKASPSLPPTPDDAACNCAVQQAHCVSSPHVSPEDIGQNMGTVCGLSQSACSDVQRDPTQGKYGSLSYCSGQQQLAIAFNAYYQQNKGQSNACNFKGAATTQKPSAGSSCSAVLSSASAEATSDGAGAAANGGSSSGGGGSSSNGGGSGGGSSSGGSSSAKSSHSGAAGQSMRTPGMVGLSEAFQLGLYTISAVGTGMLMVLL